MFDWNWLERLESIIMKMLYDFSTDKCTYENLISLCYLYLHVYKLFTLLDLEFVLNIKKLWDINGSPSVEMWSIEISELNIPTL